MRGANEPNKLYLNCTAAPIGQRQAINKERETT